MTGPGRWWRRWGTRRISPSSSLQPSPSATDPSTTASVPGLAGRARNVRAAWPGSVRAWVRTAGVTLSACAREASPEGQARRPIKHAQRIRNLCALHRQCKPARLQVAEAAYRAVEESWTQQARCSSQYIAAQHKPKSPCPAGWTRNI
jgi:hypothetical protein